MKFTIAREQSFAGYPVEILRFSGEITAHEIEAIKLDVLEQAMLNECGGYSKAEDFLLVLEMLFRRYNEQHGSSKEHKG